LRFFIQIVENELLRKIVFQVYAAYFSVNTLVVGKLKTTPYLIMPDKNEIERRKQIARELKLKARQEFEKSLPMSRDNFEGLFDYFDEQLAENPCDDTLKLSVAFLQSVKLDNIEEITKWLSEHSGYCDCEVLANVEEKFDDNAIL
jgi:hypothetical protein